jgi:hypothetical protein
MMLGSFDQDVSEKVALSYPEIYHAAGNRFTFRRFALYTADALYQSVICFNIPFALAYNNTSVHPNGYNPNLHETTGVMAMAAVFSVNLFVGLNMYSIPFVAAFGIVFSAFSLAMFLPIYSLLPESLHRFSSILFWESSMYFTVLLCVVLCLLPRVIVKYYQTNYRPNDIQILREIVKYKLNPPRVPEVSNEGPAVFTPPTTVASPASDTSTTATGRRRSVLYDVARHQVVGRTGYAFAQARGMASAAIESPGIPQNLSQIPSRNDFSLYEDMRKSLPLDVMPPEDIEPHPRMSTLTI